MAMTENDPRTWAEHYADVDNLGRCEAEWCREWVCRSEYHVKMASGEVTHIDCAEAMEREGSLVPLDEGGYAWAPEKC